MTAEYPELALVTASPTVRWWGAWCPRCGNGLPDDLPPEWDTAPIGWEIRCGLCELVLSIKGAPEARA